MRNRRRLQILYYQVSAQPSSSAGTLLLSKCLAVIASIVTLRFVCKSWLHFVATIPLWAFCLLSPVSHYRSFTVSCVLCTSHVMIDSMLQLLFHSSIPTLSCYTSILWWTRVLLSSGVETKMTWKRCVVVSSCLINIRLLPGWRTVYGWWMRCKDAHWCFEAIK